MHTRISRFADKTMEAAVLAAVLIIPLFFNIYSARIFEGEKAGLLRALALIAVTAWLIQFLERRNGGWHVALSSLRDKPVVFAAALLGLVTVIAGLTSITPRLSVWGSYQRSQGITTLLGYLVLFFVTVMVFHNPDRRRRLITSMLVASGSVAIFASIQYAGLDPVPWRSLGLSRVFGTLSNPIFLGGYLVMVMPLTLAQIVRYQFAPGGARWGGLIAWAVLLVLQLAAGLFSGSRGPLLGIITGVFLFVFLLALQSRRRRLAAGLLFFSVLGLLFLVVFNLPNTPLASLRGVPIIGRFGQIVGGGSGQVRVLIWRGVVERFAGQPVRLILGYGPESTHAALLPTYQPELHHLESERLPDRAHNAFLEALVTTGLVGAASVVFLFAALFYTGLHGLGWVSTTRSRNQWLVVTVASITLGLLAPRLIAGNWTFTGVGIGLGLMAGLGIYLILSLRQAPDVNRALTDRSILIAGVLATLVGHLMEITVGIRVTATESLFWVLAGLLVVLSASTESEEDVARTAVPSARAENGITLIWDPERAALALLGGVLLSTLAFGVFLLSGTAVSTPSLGRWILLAGTWFLAGPLWLSPPDGDIRPGTGWIYPLVSLGWVGLFLAIRAVMQVLGGDALTLLNFYFVWLLLSLVIVATLLPHQSAEVGASRVWLALVYPALMIVALGLAVWLAVKPLRADIYLEAAEANATTGQWSHALAFYEQTVREAPDVDVYQQKLGEAYITAARLVQDSNQREVLFQTGRQAFERAVTLNPAEGTHHFNLAHLYLLWGQAANDPGRQATLLNRAAGLYEQAATRMPYDPRILTEWGLVLQAQGNADAALAKYRMALKIDPKDALAYLQMGGLYQRSGKLDQALQMYQRAIELEPSRAEAYRALADLYRQQGRLVDAATAQQHAAELRPTDYVIHQNLALLYRDLGQIQNAVAEARLALNYAPSEQRAALQNFIQSLLTSSAP